MNYRPGNSIASDEIEVAVGKAFFNNRVQVSTNVGVTSTSTSTESSSQVIGDFNLEYLMTPEGKLRLKAFSQSNDRNLNQLNQAQTTQGFGIAYREEFNNFGEFLAKIGNLFRGKEKKRTVE